MSEKQIFILGGGGHAKVLIDLLKKIGRTRMGILDARLPRGLKVHGVEVCGDEDQLSGLDPSSIDLVLGIGSVDTPHMRSEIFKKFVLSKFSFLPLIHPTAILPEEFEVSEGVQIMAGTILQPGIQIGINTIVNTGCRIDHDCIVGAHCHIAPGVTMSGSVKVGDQVHIGTGAIIIQSIEIGANSFIGAGAIVTKNVPSNSRVYGARPTMKLKPIDANSST